MGFGLKSFKYKIRKSTLIPFFMDQNYDEEIVQSIEYFEKQVHHAKKSFDTEFFVELFDDYKIANGIIRTFKNIYIFKPIDFQELLGPPQIENFAKEGITKNEDLRQFVFDRVNDMYNGYLPTELREVFFEKSSDHFEIKTETLERLLWLDHDENHILIRYTEKPSKEELIGLFNFHVLDTIIKNSVKTSLLIKEKVSGFFIKNLFWLCKRFGVFCDISKEDDTLRCIFYGPIEIFGKPNKYGGRISEVFHRVMNLLEKKFEINVELILRDRTCHFSLNSEDLPLLFIPERFSGIFGEEVYDSSVEKNFSRIFEGKPNGWEVIREPEPIIVSGTVMIPDFALIRGSIKVFVEIIGFWMEDYKKKKREKLSKLKKTIENLILVVDENYKEEFNEKALGFPIIYYTRKGIPLNQILNLLKRQFNDFVDRMKFLEKNIDEIFREILVEVHEKKYIDLQRLQTILNCYHFSELKKALENINEKLTKHSLVFIPSIGLFEKTTLEKLKLDLISMIRGKKISLDQVDSFLRAQNFYFGSAAILDYFKVFKISWESLINPFVTVENSALQDRA